ncbi:MAG: PAS domain S-box protein [Methanoregulaceae archaeon]|nr:PAS domain S-box protein [Methanoregulaceae archaeon]
MTSVLYVDDEPDLLALGKIFLERTGDISVTTTESAASALELLGREPFDAVISDYLMPDMDGIELLKEVRQRFADLPFILFTGRGREEVVIAAINNGADFYIQKGGDPASQFAELSHKVRQALRRRMAELRRIQSEEKFQRLFMANPGLEAITDFSTGKLVDVNEAFVQTTGYTREEAIGKSTREIDLFPDSPDLERMAQVLANGAIVRNFEFLIRTKNGDIRTLDFSGQRIRVGNNDLLFMQAVDVTDRKRAEEVLEQSENLYRTVFENTGAATIIVAPDMTILHANNGWVKLTGVPREAQENRLAWTRFIDRDDVERMKQYHVTRRSDPAGAPTVYECRLIGADKLVHSCLVYVDIIPGTKNSVASLVDITALKQAEEGLRKSEQIYRSIIGNMQDAFYRTDLQGNLTMISPSFARELGYPDESEILGKNIREQAYVNPGDRDDLLRHLERAGKVKEHRVALRRRDGSPVIVSASSHILYDEHGNPAGVEGILHDMTETVEAENALRESEAKYRELADLLPQMVFEMDTEFRVTYANRHMLGMFGASPEDLERGINAFDFIEASQHEVVRENLRRKVEGRPGGQREYIVRRMDGSIMPVLIYPAPVFRNGKLAGYRGVMIDISDMKRMENDLRESEERFRGMAERSSDLVFILGRSMSPTYVSPSARRIIGYEPEELAGKSPEFALETIFSGSGPALAQAVRATMDGKTVEGVEIRLTRKDGNAVYVDLHAVPVMHDGVLDGAQVSMRDITERKVSEDALRLANRQLNLLSGITRHDILNKVSGILGYLKLAETKSDNPVMAEFIEKIESATEAIRSQIEFTRVYEDIGAHEPQWIDLDTVMPRAAVPETIALHADVAGVRVFADPMLERVFFNLLDNSVRHGHRVTEIRVSACCSGEDLVVVWEDNGTGIAADEKERIFERGFGENTGLGLFLVREILSLTGITIAETGEPGKGARFEITVPEGGFRLAGAH